MEFIELLDKMEIEQEETIRRFCNNESLLKKYLLKFPEEETFQRLKTAVNDKDFPQIESEAHTLKGLAANLGMKALSNYCAVIVSALRNNDSSKSVDDMFVQVEEEYNRLIQCLESSAQNL